MLNPFARISQFVFRTLAERSGKFKHLFKPNDLNQMRDEVRLCVSQSTNGQNLRSALSQYGIQMIIDLDGTGKADGLAFRKTIETGQKKNSFTVKALTLDPNLSIGAIGLQLKLNSLRTKH
jgi:hypothetical protein